jgi:hypothetical protein
MVGNLDVHMATFDDVDANVEANVAADVAQF